MDQLNAFIARVAPPPIPETGLAEVLGKWIGRGELFHTLAAVEDFNAEVRWSARDLELRAHRILFESIAPAIRRLPRRSASWIDALPASRTLEAITSTAPGPGTSWVETRIRHGWPPTSFAGRQSSRSAEMLLVTTLRWTLERLARIRREAVRSFSDADLVSRHQLDAADRALAMEPLASAPSIRPTRHDLIGLRRAGSPWGAVAEIAEAFRLLEVSPEVYVAGLLAPDEGVRWRLFHLAVLGVLLNSLKELGCTTRSLQPLGGRADGPSFEVIDSKGAIWSLWFEAAGIWGASGIRAPYVEATAGMALNERALGADILLIRSGGPALILECKYSNNVEFVSRNGYYQALAYSLEIASRLASTTVSMAIGPEGVVMHSSSTKLISGIVGVCPPSGISAVVKAFLHNERGCS